MRTPHKLLLATALVITCLPLQLPTAAAAIDIGVMAPRGPLKAMKRWLEFGKYMSKELGEKVKITPLSPSNMMPVAQAGSVDFTLANPTMAVILQESYGATPLATLNNSPTAVSRSHASSIARTTSSTYTKSRVCFPSP